MAQFQAYENPNRESKKSYPFLLDIQSSLVDQLNSTIVIPLAPRKGLVLPITKLTPLVQVNGAGFWVLTQQISGYDRRSLGPPIADLSIYRFEIIAAIDFVISGV